MEPKVLHILKSGGILLRDKGAKFHFRGQLENRYGSFEDINMLQELADRIEEKEDRTYEGREALFQIYMQMWSLEPEQTHYQTITTRLILDLAWDLKRYQMNYERAQLFFEDLLRFHEPRPIPIAHYRLGFIHYYNKRYRDAIDHLERALNPSLVAEDRYLNHEKLCDKQRMRATAQLAMTFNKMSVETALRAKTIHDSLEEVDEQDWDTIRQLEERNLLEELELPYMCITPKGRMPLNDLAYRAILRDDSAFVMDCTNPVQKHIYLNGQSRSIASRRSDMLKLLFLQLPRPVSQQIIEETLGISQVSRYMNLLRQDISDFGCNDLIIEGVHGKGYYVRHPNPILICRNNDPIYIM